MDEAENTETLLVFSLPSVSVIACAKGSLLEDWNRHFHLDLLLQNLEERQARRRQMVEYKKMMEDGENEEVKNRVVTLDDLLKLQVGDSKITEKNKEEILHKFVVHMKHYKQMAKDSKFIIYMKH